MVIQICGDGKLYFHLQYTKDIRQYAHQTTSSSTTYQQNSRSARDFCKILQKQQTKSILYLCPSFFFAFRKNTKQQRNQIFLFLCQRSTVIMRPLQKATRCLIGAGIIYFEKIRFTPIRPAEEEAFPIKYNAHFVLHQIANNTIDGQYLQSHMSPVHIAEPPDRLARAVLCQGR